MAVCRMRSTPVIIFINKMDREGKDPFDLLDELQEKLHIHVRPLGWPISQVKASGVYNLYRKELNLFEAHKTRIGENRRRSRTSAMNNSTELVRKIRRQTAEDVQLVEGVFRTLRYRPLSRWTARSRVLRSAINNFGVQELRKRSSRSHRVRVPVRRRNGNLPDRAKFQRLHIQIPREPGPEPPRPDRLPTFSAPENSSNTDTGIHGSTRKPFFPTTSFMANENRSSKKPIPAMGRTLHLTTSSRLG